MNVKNARPLFTYELLGAPASDAELKSQVITALSRKYGMRAADPGPTARVELGAEQNGARAWAVNLGSMRATGEYAVAAHEVLVQSWKHRG